MKQNHTFDEITLSTKLIDLTLKLLCNAYNYGLFAILQNSNENQD
jgi:hypothetical protein